MFVNMVQYNIFTCMIQSSRNPGKGSPLNPAQNQNTQLHSIKPNFGARKLRDINFQRTWFDFSRHIARMSFWEASSRGPAAAAGSGVPVSLRPMAMTCTNADGATYSWSFQRAMHSPRLVTFATYNNMKYMAHTKSGAQYMYVRICALAASK